MEAWGQGGGQDDIREKQSGWLGGVGGGAGAVHTLQLTLTGNVNNGAE